MFSGTEYQESQWDLLQERLWYCAEGYWELLILACEEIACHYMVTTEAELIAMSSTSTKLM